MIGNKCPTQEAFMKRLAELFVLRDKATLFPEDRFIKMEYYEHLASFVNNWCPTFNKYEEFVEEKRPGNYSGPKP